MIGYRVTWRRRLGVLTVAWYTLRCGRVTLAALVHLPLR